MVPRHRVLVVEDDEGLRYALAKALERSEMSVDVAADGREALEQLDSHGANYCCVILDLLLPNVHGASIVSHVARAVPKLPIIAVTGYPDRVLFADPADRDVVKAIFAKPVDPSDVAAYIHSRCTRDGMRVGA